MGKKEERVRPTTVTFSTLGTKIKILKQNKSTKRYQLLDKRQKELQEQLQLEREKGNIDIINDDKLIIPKNNTKRRMHNSPENVTNIHEEKNIQKNKKNTITKQPNNYTLQHIAIKK